MSVFGGPCELCDDQRPSFDTTADRLRDLHREVHALQREVVEASGFARLYWWLVRRLA